MNKVSVIDAIKFGFRATIKKPWFFIGSCFVSFFIIIIGIISAIIAALPFVIPVIFSIKSLGSAFMELIEKTVNQGSQIMQGVGKTPDLGVGDIFDNIIKIVTGFISNAFTLILKHSGIIALIILAVLVVIFVFSLAYNIIYLGWARIALDFKDKGESCISAFSPNFSLVIRAVFAGFLSKFIASIPFWITVFIAFIFPNIWALKITILSILFIASAVIGIYFTLKFFFCKFFILDQNAGIIESLRKSFNLHGAPVRLILLWLIYIALYICLGVTILLLNWIFSWLLKVATITALLSFVLRVSFSFFSWVIGWLAMSYFYRGLLKDKPKFLR